jgi:hypothetical protein
MASVNWDLVFSIVLIALGLFDLWSVPRQVKAHVARVKQAVKNAEDWPTRGAKRPGKKGDSKATVYTNEVTIPERWARELGLYPHRGLSTESIASAVTGVALTVIGGIGVMLSIAAAERALGVFKLLALAAKVGIWIYRKVRWEHGR